MNIAATLVDNMRLSSFGSCRGLSAPRFRVMRCNARSIVVDLWRTTAGRERVAASFATPAREELIMKRKLAALVAILTVIGGVGWKLASRSEASVELRDVGLLQQSEHSQPG